MSKGTVSGGTDGLYTATILKNDGTPEVKSAYCADLTEDLSGNVGIIEIAGDITNGVNIQPGYEGNAVYNATRDGEMYEVPQKPETQPSTGVYWNWAMKPGWQKWRSKYRYAIISDLYRDADTCTVTFDPCYATDAPDGEQIDVNQKTSMSATIDYMSCNADAFMDGDSVIVELTHDASNVWISAKVVGFEQCPRGCYWEGWIGPTLCESNTWYDTATADYEDPEFMPNPHPIECPVLPFTYRPYNSIGAPACPMEYTIIDDRDSCEHGLQIIVTNTVESPGLFRTGNMLFCIPDVAGSKYVYRVKISGMNNYGTTTFSEHVCFSAGDAVWWGVDYLTSLRLNGAWNVHGNVDGVYELSITSGWAFMMSMCIEGGSTITILIKYIDLLE